MPPSLPPEIERLILSFIPAHGLSSSLLASRQLSMVWLPALGDTGCACCHRMYLRGLVRGSWTWSAYYWVAHLTMPPYHLSLCEHCFLPLMYYPGLDGVYRRRQSSGPSHPYSHVVLRLPWGYGRVRAFTRHPAHPSCPS